MSIHTVDANGWHMHYQLKETGDLTIIDEAAELTREQWDLIAARAGAEGGDVTYHE